jgi:hypothetical protein
MLKEAVGMLKYALRSRQQRGARETNRKASAGALSL